MRTFTSTYDLTKKPCSFDFLSYLGVARTHGVNHVRFVKGPWKSKNYGDPKARFESIVRPACEITRTVYSFGPPEGPEYGHLVGDIIRTWQEFGRIAPLGKHKGGDYITVTLRNSRRETRNSNTEAWYRFAKEVKAVVVPDYDDKPISLAERLSLYEGARLNMFVNNGPAILCVFSDIPYAILKFADDGAGQATHSDWLAGQGLPKGSQWPFATEKQRIFWGSDTYEEIREAYECLNRSL